MSGELWRKSAVELANDIRQRKVSSREVIEAHLDRITEVNPQVNAIVRVLGDQARAAADLADAAISRGDVLGAFHGVPITVKENIDMAGLPTTQGIPALAEAIPQLDAPVVERMRAAGAIPIGRTNLPDLGLRVHTDSTLYGRTKNPWKSDRTAGGSSGGEGAALATGMSPLGLGNDIGGSLRNPAHCCGIASIKPTTGVIPDAQMFPIEDIGLSAQIMLNQGVMARRIADVRAGFLVVAGAHPRDPISVPANLVDLQGGEKIRVAVLAEPPGGSTHPEIAAAVRRAGDALSSAGHIVTSASPPDYELACATWSVQLNGELLLQWPLLEAVVGIGGMKFLTLAREVLPEVDLAAWANAQLIRNGIARRWSLWFQNYDILLTPVWTQPPFLYDADIANTQGALDTFELLRPVLPGNLLGVPCVAVPAGMAGGMPTGVQVIGARFSDLRCLAIAEQIEAECGLDTPIDPIA
ncbi:MAG: amidase [Ilumatobacteraceae bacterium]